MGFDIGESETNTSQKFRRTGTQISDRSSIRPDWLRTHMRSLIEGAEPSPALSDANEASVLALLTRDFSVPPGLETLQASMGIAPTSFTGSSALESIAGIDPYSETFKTGASDFFRDAFTEAGATARTGPEAVRGGHAHGAMVEANVLEKMALDKFREITGLQLGQAEMTQRATQLLQGIGSSRRAEQVNAQGMWTDQFLRGLGMQLGAGNELNQQRGISSATTANIGPEFGTGRVKQTDNMSGAGTQVSNTSQWSTGMNLCCFIFLEALNGELPWYVRSARDQLCTPQSVAGYRRMSNWLVPLMRRSRVARRLTNALLVKPLMRYGSWFYQAGDKGTKFGWTLKPVFNGWSTIWHFLGRKVTNYGQLSISR